MKRPVKNQVMTPFGSDPGSNGFDPIRLSGHVSVGVRLIYSRDFLHNLLIFLVPTNLTLLEI